MHRAITILLIAGLLICPYRCQGAAVEVRAVPMSCAVEKASSGCRCCQARPKAAQASEAINPSERFARVDQSAFFSSTTAPLSDESPCSCGNCLCHGAFLKKAAVELDHCGLVPRMMPIPGDLEARIASASRSDSPPGPLLSAGRMLRLAIRSLQI